MTLTNLTFGDGTNKALLCGLRGFMRALVAQLHSPNEDLTQVRYSAGPTGASQGFSCLVRSCAQDVSMFLDVRAKFWIFEVENYQLGCWSVGNS